MRLRLEGINWVYLMQLCACGMHVCIMVRNSENLHFSQISTFAKVYLIEF